MQPAAEFGTVGGMDDMSLPQAFWKLHGLLKEAHLHDSPLAPGDPPCSSLDPSELFRLAEELVDLFVEPPPRPWHYVTEKLPEPRQRVRFWTTNPEGRQRATRGLFILSTLGTAWFGAWPTQEHAELSPDGAVAYAWEAEPEPPPLPETER